MNVLQVIQEFCRRTGQPVPAGAQSSADPQVLQLFALMNEFLEDMQTRKATNINLLEANFTSTAAEDQGLITTICPYGFEGIVWETMFNRTTMMPLNGGLSPTEWQVRKAAGFSGPFYQFRIRGNRLLFNPALPVGQSIYFEYISRYFVIAAADSSRKEYFTLDSDTCVFKDSIPLAWLRWKWKAEKGFDYAEDFRKYELLVTTMLMKDGEPTAISMDATAQDLRPGILVPQGSWNMS